MKACPLCDDSGGRLVVQGPRWRVIHASEPGFPGFYRLVWQDHVREFSQLSRIERGECMELVATIEEAMLRQLQPTKVNLAALGNAVPHLHWHVIARYDWDSHFPGATWAAAQRPVDEPRLAQVADRLPALEEMLRSALAAAA